MESGEGDTGSKSSWQRLKDGIKNRLTSTSKTSEAEVKEEPKPPKVSVKGPLPSKTLGPNPPTWLAKQQKEMEEAREKQLKEERASDAPPSLTPDPEFAHKFEQAPSEQEPVAQAQQAETQTEAAKTSQASTEVEHLRPGMTEQQAEKLGETVVRIKQREELKKAA